MLACLVGGHASTFSRQQADVGDQAQTMPPMGSAGSPSEARNTQAAAPLHQVVEHRVVVPRRRTQEHATQAQQRTT